MPNRLQEIQLWFGDRSSQISLPESLFNSLARPAEFNKTLGGVDSVTITLYASCTLATASEGDSFRLSQGKVLRFVYDDGDIQEFRITRGSRQFSGESDRQISAEPISQDLENVTVRRTLSNGHARATVGFYQQSFSNIADKLLSTEFNCPSYFVLGNVPAAFDNQVYNLNLNAAYLISALKELTSAAGGEWDVTYNAGNNNYEVNFYEDGQLGGGKAEAADRTFGIGGGQGNRLKLQRKDESERYVSRVIPLMGQENQTQTIGGARWEVASKSGQNATLEDDAIAKDGYGLISGQTIYFGNEAQGYYELQATTAPDTLTLAGNISGLSYGYFKEGAAKNDVVFIEDVAALENLGVKEEKFSRTDIIPYANLAEDAGISVALSDWSSGLPEGFSGISGNETVSQESNAIFVKHGVLAAKIEADTDEGLQTVSIDINPQDLSPYFSLQTYLQVQAGSVRIEIEDSEGTIYPTDVRAETNAKETVGLSIGGEEIPEGTATIKFIANEDSTVFYIDALTFTQSSSPQPYRPLMGPRALWMEAGKYLKKHAGDSPDIWEGEGYDNAFFSSDSEIEIGSWVTVQEDYENGAFETERVLRVIEMQYSEDRINGRMKKQLKLASERSDASRFFQEQFVTKDDLQGGVSVEQVPNKGFLTRDDYFSLLIGNQEYTNADAITKTTAELTGVVTSIPVEPFEDIFAGPGDKFYVYDLEANILTAFELDLPMQADDTELSVISKDLGATVIPTGSYIIYTAEQIGAFINRTKTAVSLGVGEWQYQTDEFGNILFDENGDPLYTTSGYDVNALDDRESSHFRLLSGKAVLTTDGAGGLALIRLDSTASEGSSITLKADSIDIDSVKTAIVADETIKIQAANINIEALVNEINQDSEINIVADDVNLNNWTFDKASGSLISDNFVPGSGGQGIGLFPAIGEAELNTVILRNGVLEDSEIRDLVINGELSFASNGALIMPSSTQSNGSITAGGIGMAYDQSISFGLASAGTSVQIEYDTSVSKFLIDSADTMRLSGGAGGLNFLEFTNDNTILGFLPSSDPTVDGAIWNDNGTLKISAG